MYRVAQGDSAFGMSCKSAQCKHTQGVPKGFATLFSTFQMICKAPQHTLWSLKLLWWQRECVRVCARARVCLTAYK